MKYKFILILITSFIIYTPIYSNELDCTQFKKFSAKYIECNTKNLKEKTNQKIKSGKDKIENSGIKDKLKKFKTSKTLKDLVKD